MKDFMMAEITMDTLFDGRLTVKQARFGYRFSVDAVILAHVAAALQGRRVLDLGTGCGIIPLIMGYRCPTAEIFGVEIQAALVNLAQENIVDNGMSQHVNITLGDIRSLKASDVNGCVDLVLANPPFYKTIDGRISPNSQRAVARHEVKVTIFDIVDAAYRLLQNKGRFVSIYQTTRMVDLISKMREIGLEPRMIRPIQTKEGLPCKLFLVEGEKGGGRGLVMPPPLVIHLKNNTYSPEVAQMFLP